LTLLAERQNAGCRGSRRHDHAKLSDLKSSAQIAADELHDPEVAAELERTSVAGPGAV